MNTQHRGIMKTSILWDKKEIARRKSTEFLEGNFASKERVFLSDSYLFHFGCSKLNKRSEIFFQNVG
jgi:hypothetical protein